MNLPHITKTKLEEELSKIGYLDNDVKKAIDIAIQAHKGKKRDDGTPYLTQHIYPIAYELLVIVPKDQLTKETLITALLHDVIEDSHFTEEDIELQFGPFIAQNVSILTKDPKDNIKYDSDAKKRQVTQDTVELIAQQPDDIILIKLLDRKNNLQSSQTIQTTRPVKFKRYLEQTIELFIPLAHRINPKLEREFKKIIDEFQTSYSEKTSA